MAVWPFTGRSMPTRHVRGQSKRLTRFTHAWPHTRPNSPAIRARTLRFAHFQHTATHVHTFASWAHKACHHFSQHCQHYACTARCRRHYSHASRKPCTFPHSNCRLESHLATFLLLATLTRLRGNMVNFVLHPLTQIFMQEYREYVRNECYNVQSPPLARLPPL